HAAARVQSLSWVPVRPPIAAGLHRHTLPCATFRSPHICWCVEFFDIGCWQITGASIAAARPLICHGPLYTASSCCCQVQSLSWVPVRPPIAAVSIATLLPCATFRSPHTLLVCSIF
ncbi:unnamed protein product, partial [Staurois parvus]